ncbi:MAG: toprim domain-containing protein [Nanoarchaeota archaeon]|nr:toprim domain-containing protein [Nanoarchaeota archaeon]
MIPHQIRSFLEIWKKLPGLGPRAATRLAFFIANMKAEERHALREALAGLDAMDACPECFSLKEEDRSVCAICGNTERKRDLVAVVEKNTDIITLERAREFQGTYLILGDLGTNGILEEHHRKRMEHLKKRIEKEKGTIKEVILAMGPNALSDMVYEMLKRDLSPLGVSVTRLGRGIPTGGEIEFADEETLKSALRRRM